MNIPQWQIKYLVLHSVLLYNVGYMTFSSKRISLLKSKKSMLCEFLLLSEETRRRPLQLNFSPHFEKQLGLFLLWQQHKSPQTTQELEMFLSITRTDTHTQSCKTRISAWNAAVLLMENTNRQGNNQHNQIFFLLDNNVRLWRARCFHFLVYTPEDCHHKSCEMHFQVF